MIYFQTNGSVVPPPVVITVEKDADHDVAVQANGQVVLWLTRGGRIARATNERLAELGFVLDNDDKVVVG